MNSKRVPDNEAAAANITRRIEDLAGWQKATLARVRQLIHAADPEILEKWKWVKPTSAGTPVWSHDGIVCTGERCKEKLKLTFAHGASINEPKKLFNASLEGNARRAIEFAGVGTKLPLPHAETGRQAEVGRAIKH